MTALAHQRGHRDHAIRRDQRGFDKAIGAAQAMSVRHATGLDIDRALHRIAAIERNKALCVLMQSDEKPLIR